MQGWTLYKKEIYENMHNKKWIWMPLVFFLLTVMDPLTNYFLPEILHAVGGLPEGAVFQMPYITKIDAIMMSFGQLGTLSVLLITLSSMGTIAAEQKRVYSKSF